MKLLSNAFKGWVIWPITLICCHLAVMAAHAGGTVTNGYLTAVLRSQCANSPVPPPPVGGTRTGPDYVIMTVADGNPRNWTNAQQVVTDAIFQSLMPLYCALPNTNCVTDSVQWNIITYDTNGNPVTSGCAASGCQLHTCSGANTSCTPPASGLAAWWPGEGNGNDVVGGNNATLMNGLGFATGEVGQAFNFNGSYNYLLVNATPTLNVGAGSGLTFEAWIYPRTLNQEELIFEFEQNLGTANAADSGCNCSLHPDKPGALYSNISGTDGSSHELVSPFYLLVPNAWQHIGITYDKASGIAALYINGSAVLVTNIGTFTPETTHSHLVMGARTTYNSVTHPGDGVNGLMDEMSFYSRALSSNEIAAVYHAGSAGKCSVTSPLAPYITSQPVGLSVAVSNSATFTVTANGTAPLFYQWSFGSTVLTNATNATLVLPNVQFDQAGSYSVLISNSAGTTNSAAATLTVLPPPPPATCTPPPSGLVAWWPGEGNANDVIGGNNGVLINGTSFTTGEVNQAFNFNGYNNYILVNTTPDLNVGTGPGLTFEGWIYPISLAQEELIFEFEENLGSYNADDAGINCSLHPDKPGALYSNIAGVDNTSHELVSPYNIIVPNAWQHIAITYDKASGAAALYLNGSAVLVTNIGSFTPKTTASHLVMGARTTYNSVSYPGDGVYGKMDELCFYSRALSPDEIAAIYNAGNAGKCAGPLIPPAIISQPGNLTITVSNTATFAVTATGSAPLAYQWSFGTTPLDGATNATLVLPNVQLAQAGNYSVQITNAAGSTNSATAVLTVNTPPPPPPPPSCTPPPSGLVAWWPGEGNANDVVGGNDAILMNYTLSTNSGTGSTTTNGQAGPIYTNIITGQPFGNGEVNQAFNFNGYDNYLLVHTTPALNVGAGGGLTFEGWIYLNSLAKEQLIFEFENHLGTANGSDAGFNCSLHPDKPGALYANLAGTDGMSHELLSPFYAIVAGAWQHIAITYDKTSGAAVLYVNGAQVTAANIGSVTPQTSFTNLVMGARTTYNSVPYPGDAVWGLMDELSFYSRALSAGEIAAIYNAGSAGKCTQAAPVARPSVAVAPPPRPAMALTSVKGNNLQLAWPAGSGSFHVQAADAPAGPWTTVALPIITNGANATIMVSPTNQQLYFRLVAP